MEFNWLFKRVFRDSFFSFQNELQKGEPIIAEVGLTKEALEILKNLKKFLEKEFKIKIKKEELMSFLAYLQFRNCGDSKK